jgi:predicted phosphodiesterase
MPQTIIDLLNRGTQANHEDLFRQGNVIYLPADGTLIATGDLHGHKRNFERIVKFSDLANNPDRHVLLQEIIHGGLEDDRGGCLSYRLLFDVVRYKLEFPSQVHVIMGNHDSAFICDNEVIKNGKEMNRAIRSALNGEFRQDSHAVIEAIIQLLFSQPLAVRCENRIWLSHSLPSDRHFDDFDRQIFDRPLTHADTSKPGSAYLLIWGRKHSQELLDKMAKLLDADIFILGHQAQECGWSQAGNNLIIIASDHNHGCILPIDLARAYTTEQLIDALVPLTSIA